ncbi:Asx homology domain-containing protein [Mycena belliarum]|uniref:Asx homology domain-containing protein n=1 Tax=Mycena belliarum TaxID=1033014 RepID=A0AAD6U606_9AGAR|nr:Asx homology domain-containing protein [Mycena belliae]
MADESALRRSNRRPKPAQRETAPPVNVPSKRKAKEDASPADQLHFLLQNPKSRLTKIDMSELINANSWDMLSPDSQTRLAALLPPTAFRSFQPTIGLDHPAADNTMQLDQKPSDSVDTSFFADPHFLAAARTFQDHLFSNWLSDAHAEKVKKYEQGIKDGSLAAPWKDEVWERDNQREERTTTSAANNLAGEAAELKLIDLAKNSVLREGDVIAYKRNFTNLDIVVEKDVIIQKIDRRTHSLTVLLEPGPTRDLPSHLLMPGPTEPAAPTRIMTITSPTQLESGLLDVDGRVERAKRPNGNAWKALTLWRWSGDALNHSSQPQSNEDRRGGRQDHGTLFYLRACYYQDR